MRLFLMSCWPLLWIATTSHALINPALLSKVRAAMVTTTESSTNVGKAYEACGMWDELPMGDLPPAVQAVSSVLHATCLVRVGRDDDALLAYQSCLDNNDDNPASTLFLEPKTLQDAIIGRASILQRLMRYDEAIEQFLLVHKYDDDRGILGAVTCCMRLGQLERATRILEERQGSSREECATLSLLNILQGGVVDDKAIEVLQGAAPESPLFQWLANVVSGSSTSERQYGILQLAAINQSPFDDPLLLYLDDKIHLHRLLEKSGDLDFWPQGFILPDDMDSFQEQQEAHKEHATRKHWILKSRAGYGSHGNQITSAAEACIGRKGMESRLCQRLVDPPLLLLDGRKFSMRVYVYSFVDGSVYLSNRGLVKIASQVYDANDDDDMNSMHMTNSGREDTMTQYGFDYLRDTFDREGWSYDNFWDKIRQAVTETMRCYQIECNEQQFDETSNSQRRELAKLGIPKILGFDFMPTTNNDRQPMLLEVNRFPGLEGRGQGDDAVKQTVVKDAWVCAANRLTSDHSVGSQLLSEELSYEPLSII